MRTNTCLIATVGFCFMAISLQCNAANEACHTDLKVSAFSAHGALLDRDCVLWMWGFNERGQLGTAPSTSWGPESMRRVRGLPPLIDVAVAGNHTLAISMDRRAYVWGSIEYLECSDTSGHSKPKLVGRTQDVRAIAASKYLHLLLDGKGDVFQHGCMPLQGLKERDMRPEPSKVSLPPVQAIAVGSAHALALTTDGDVYSWGDNSFAQLGASGLESRSQAAKVYGLPKVKAIAAGAWHSIAMGMDGSVWTWGSNEDWHLGIPVLKRWNVDKSDAYLTRPIQVQGLPAVVQIGSGGMYSLAVGADGRVFVWGNVSRGYPIPAEIEQLRGKSHAVSAGGHAAVTDGVFAVTDSGGVMRWQFRPPINYNEMPSPPSSGDVTNFDVPAGEK